MDAQTTCVTSAAAAAASTFRVPRMLVVTVRCTSTSASDGSRWAARWKITSGRTRATSRSSAFRSRMSACRYSVPPGRGRTGVTPRLTLTTRAGRYFASSSSSAAPMHPEPPVTSRWAPSSHRASGSVGRHRFRSAMARKRASSRAAAGLAACSERVAARSATSAASSSRACPGGAAARIRAMTVPAGSAAIDPPRYRAWQRAVPLAPRGYAAAGTAHKEIGTTPEVSSPVRKTGTLADTAGYLQTAGKRGPGDRPEMY